jgi:hypothetical protein
MPGPDDIMASALERYDADFPVTLYDRPTLAMSNLLLRGDIDAATRAIFTPQTLSPGEMQTMRAKLAGSNPHPVVKTVLDVATNPLVLLGLIGGYLIYPSASPQALLQLYQGLRAAPPMGAIGRFVSGAFARLRQYPGLHDNIMGLGRDSMGFVTKWGDEFREAYGTVPGVGKGNPAGHLMALKLQGLDKTGSRMAKFYGKHGLKDVPIVQGAQGVLTPQQLSATQKTRNIFDRLFLKELKRDPDLYAQLVKDAKARGIKVGDYVKDYWPHHVMPNEMQRRLSRQITGATRASELGPLSKNLWHYTGQVIPDPHQLRALEGAGVRVGATDEILQAAETMVAGFQAKLNPIVAQGLQQKNAAKALRDGIYKLLGKGPGNKEMAQVAAQQIYGAAARGEDIATATASMARMLKYPGTYSLDFAPSIERYLAKMAPTWSWHWAGHGKAIQKSLAHFKNTGTLAARDEHYIKEQLLPYMTGRRTARQMARATSLNEWKFARAEWLRRHPLAKKVIPADSRQWLIARLEDTSFADSEALGHGINHYLYLSTMGANIGPPSKNIFQNILTFANMPGMGFTGLGKGAGEVLRRGSGYLDDIAKGAGAEKAFRKRFPEFVEMLGPGTNVVERMFAGVAPGEVTARTVARGTVQKIEAAMMAPFKSSEMLNRLIAFYGARRQALGWGAADDVAKKIAANIVDVAHFTGGPTGIPSGTLDWWAALRQFTQFPLRFAGFMGASGRWGPSPATFDPGTIFRTLGVSAAAYTVGKGLLNMDLSQGLAMGALPLPQYEYAPFYPAPLVPPIVQMAGNVVKGAATGEARPVVDTATLLVPGGLAARRLMKTLGPKRADYRNRLPDGRVPVYNQDGGLIGAYSPLQLSLRAIGLMPGDAAAERGAAEWLVKQRDQIRAYRRAWLDAQMANDPVKAEKIQKDFGKQYPELGRLEFKKSDINAIEQRRQTARVNRIIRGFPRAYKPLFENIVREAELGAFTQTLSQMSPLPPELEMMR